MRFEEAINAGAVQNKPDRHYTAVLMVAPGNKVLLAEKPHGTWCLQSRMCPPSQDAGTQAYLISDIFNLLVTSVLSVSHTHDQIDPFDKKVERFRVVLATVKQHSSDFLRQSAWYEASNLPEGLSLMARQAIDLAYSEGALSEVEQLAA